LDHTVVHFEIPANNPEKLSEFYKNLFGWSVEKTPMGEMGDYFMFETRAGTARDMEKSQNTAGANGGMMKKMDASQRPVNYIMVESVDEYSKKIQNLGGRIVVPKTPIPNMGAFAIGLDPEGNSIGIFEATQ
jgi:predicted enzyme related to lactoylglutathione lyase